MKKNKIMRIASVLLVAVLLSTCAISGTFAKYVTTTAASDTARVAKWGVELATDTNLFGEDYVAVGDGNIIGTTNLTVESKVDNEDVVAPGTTGKMTFSISGEAEVKVNVKITLNEGSALKMITVPAKNGYKDYTVSPVGTFDLAAVYNPIKWTLKRSETADGAKSVVNSLENVNLQTIENYFATLNDKDYAANTNLAETYGYYELSWVWEFSGNDQADTLLAKKAFGTETDTGILTVEAFSLKIAVTQVD